MYILVFRDDDAVFRIKCPDGRYIGVFKFAEDAEDILSELNGLKNPN